VCQPCDVGYYCPGGSKKASKPTDDMGKQYNCNPDNTVGLTTKGQRATSAAECSKQLLMDVWNGSWWGATAAAFIGQHPSQQLHGHRHLWQLTTLVAARRQSYSHVHNWWAQHQLSVINISVMFACAVVDARRRNGGVRTATDQEWPCSEMCRRHVLTAQQSAQHLPQVPVRTAELSSWHCPQCRSAGGLP
jgi:hypothetical protein